MTDIPLPERQFTLTFGHHTQMDPWTDVRSLSWAELCTILTTHKVGAKAGTGIVPAVFRGTARTMADADRIDVAVLDSDAGATLGEIESAVVANGWAAIVSSTHSHLATQTRVTRTQWTRYLKTAGDQGTAEAFLMAEKGYLASVADGASIRDSAGDYVTIIHQPCPKFRIAIPLLRAWRAADYPDQAQANATWKSHIEAIAAALSLKHDQACTDTSRLFFLPRRPQVGPTPETLVIDGGLCDIGSLPRAAHAEREKSHQQSVGLASFEFPDPETGEIVDLAAWARRSAGSFQIVSALRARQPGAFTGRIADQTRHHIRCANEEAHTQGGQDAATFVVNASDSATKGFVYHCRHAHCDGRDRLFFLRRMLELGWLVIPDLTNPEFHNNRRQQRPVIQVTDGELPALVDQAEQALRDADLGLYQRGGAIVRPGYVTATVKSDDAPRILEVGDHALREAMMEAADWQKVDSRRKGGWAACDAPMKVATTYHERVGKWRLPILTGIITAPTLRSDGSIVADPGYDAETGLLFVTGCTRFPAVSARPTHAQALKAIELLEKLLRTFPFVVEADRSVMVAAVLTASIRRSLRTAPLFAFTAPIAGSGKSMLVDLISIITTGREASVIAQGKTAEEFEKRLGSLLLSGDQVIAIDNCEAPLTSELLCSMLTQQTVRPRILGRSEAPELPSTALVTATGNNLVLVGDLTRRSLLCRLDPQAERPELRVFDTDPVAIAKKHRPRLLVAALTVLRAYRVAGYPDEPDPLGSFREWSRWVRGALLWLGRADPVLTMETTRQSDPNLGRLVAVLVQWREVIGSTEMTAREVIVRAEGRKPGDKPGVEGAGHPDLYEAIRMVAGDSVGLNSRKLGNWLSEHQDRIAEGMRIVRCGKTAGIQRWRLDVVAASSSPSS